MNWKRLKVADCESRSLSILYTNYNSKGEKKTGGNIHRGKEEKGQRKLENVPNKIGDVTYKP